MEPANMSHGKSESVSSSITFGNGVTVGTSTTRGKCVSSSSRDGSLDAVKQQLEKERQRIQTKADALQSQLIALQGDVHKVNAAISALQGNEEVSKLAGSPKGKEKKKPACPSANKAQVIELISKVLSECKVLSVDDLMKRVETILVEDGYSRSGFLNKTKEGKQFPSAVISRSYKSGDTFKDSSSYGARHLAELRPHSKHHLRWARRSRPQPLAVVVEHLGFQPTPHAEKCRPFWRPVFDLACVEAWRELIHPHE